MAVARALRHEPAFEGRIIGLGYNALDPGFYMEGLLDGGGVLPYPSSGKDALLARLKALRETFGIDVLVPTLDSELRAVIGLSAELRAMGIRTYLPSLESLERSSKPRLAELNQTQGVRVPDSEAISTADAIGRIGERFGFPLMVKGPYYGGDIAYSESDAVISFHKFVATWGVPVILQKFVAGEEYNVAAIGDGAGGLVGAVAMRKMALTGQGQGLERSDGGQPCPAGDDRRGGGGAEVARAVGSGVHAGELHGRPVRG